MLLTKKMSQVGLKRTEGGVTGKIGPSWVNYCIGYFGLERMVKKYMEDRC